MNTDWQGRPVPEGETPDTAITVWEIEPHSDPDFDYAVERSYQAACALARLSLEKIMDDADDVELHGEGRLVTVRLRRMTLAEYEEIVANVE